MNLIALLVASTLQLPQAPAGYVDDPGVVATGQRITPAGVQTVFAGKVGGVRFGSTPGEIWVAVPGAVHRLAWADNRTIARARIDGRPGIFAVAIDPATKAAVISSVGRLPSAMAAGDKRAPEVAQLSTFHDDAVGDSVVPDASSGAIGDYMIGAPAIAARAAPNGKRLAVVPLPANDALMVLDAETGAPLHTIPLGVEPIAAVISSDSRFAYVSVLGGPKPNPRQRSARQCCDPRAEAVRVDGRGLAESGSVSQIDLTKGEVVRDIVVARHPTALVWDEPGARLYVADGNSDSVSVIDTQADTVTAHIAVAPFRERNVGLAPTALALSPDHRTLYVALGGVNAVAVYEIGVPGATPLFKGLIPTSWYPSSIDASADGRDIAVGSLFGVGSGEGKLAGQRGRYVFAIRGAVDVIPVPTPSQLAAYTTAVSENNKLALMSVPTLAATPVAAPKAVPDRPGDPSRINHVVFIVRENRTYDQVLGDLDRGSHDSSLVMYGRDVTPNAHALAHEFVTLDHFFVSGGNSADGHQWLTQANETDYPMWPLYYGRSYPSEGNDPLAYSSGGFLWEAAAAKGKTVAVFGEYAPAPKFEVDTVRARMWTQYRGKPNDFDFQRAILQKRFNTHSDIPSLDRVLVREYPGWTQEVPDVIKAGDILAHLADWEKTGEMPNLVMIVLPNDHTQGTSPGWCAPKACVADNDLALGKIVDGLSHSSFWKDMAILVVEDDAQNGVDHVDGHRTVALAISPYTRRGIVDSTVYTQPSMLKTIELMLGLGSMSIFDLVATDMRASFIDANEQPNLAPYTALEPKQSLLDLNPRVRTIEGRYSTERKAAALASARMRFDGPDEAPAERLNRILWHDARGWNVPYPGVKRALFFPLAVDVDDDDRPVAKAKPDRR
ncbi:MAG TPA: bifunctional YncE family protein/alkaline phosphatase family protein [Gemmatimonadaceae bacterium]|nr:bifunctional YncE family protein/alkaline phosphatase family protein [Gemmatimonadaceae bacterium]